MIIHIFLTSLAISKPQITLLLHTIFRRVSYGINKILFNHRRLSSVRYQNHSMQTKAVLKTNFCLLITLSLVTALPSLYCNQCPLQQMQFFLGGGVFGLCVHVVRTNIILVYTKSTYIDHKCHGTYHTSFIQRKLNEISPTFSKPK